MEWVPQICSIAVAEILSNGSACPSPRYTLPCIDTLGENKMERETEEERDEILILSSDP